MCSNIIKNSIVLFASTYICYSIQFLLNSELNAQEATSAQVGAGATKA